MMIYSHGIDSLVCSPRRSLSVVIRDVTRISEPEIAYYTRDPGVLDALSPSNSHLRVSSSSSFEKTYRKDRPVKRKKEKRKRKKDGTYVSCSENN
mgnify:CR=1 FL=1